MTIPRSEDNSCFCLEMEMYIMKTYIIPLILKYIEILPDDIELWKTGILLFNDMWNNGLKLIYYPLGKYSLQAIVFDSSFNDVYFCEFNTFCGKIRCVIVFTLLGYVVLKCEERRNIRWDTNLLINLLDLCFYCYTLFKALSTGLNYLHPFLHTIMNLSTYR